MSNRIARKSSRQMYMLSAGLLASLVGITWTAVWTPPSALAAPSLSPYIWGTNVSLYNQSDAFLTNPTTAQLTQHMHAQMIRFPDRGDQAVTEAAVKKIKSLQTVPLLILPLWEGEGWTQPTTDPNDEYHLWHRHRLLRIWQ